MTDKLRELAPAILEKIEGSSRILLHLHPSPDMDSVGSALGMMHMLRAMGKKATVIKGDSELPAYLRPLPGFEEIEEKAFGETDLSGYDLFLILDASSPNRISAIVNVAFPPHLRTAVIDHHTTTAVFADIMLVDPSYSSVAEMLHDLFGLWDVPLTEDSALCLLIGIYGDTGNFAQPNATPSALRAAAALLEHAPGFHGMLSRVYSSGTAEDLAFAALALGSIETILPNVAAAAVSRTMLEERGLGEQGSAAAARSMMRSVAAWDVTALLHEKIAGENYISMRSRDGARFDVSAVAAKLGGGGHKAAAGTLLKCPFEEARERLRAALIEAFGEKQGD